jgi:HEAT repeat protein
VLGAIGPAAIPALVEVASYAPGLASIALQEIVALEPAEPFGQEFDLWSQWHPQSDRLERIARYVTPILPRIAEIMERDIRAWRPQGDAPQRPAAYLLARWGTNQKKTRGLEVLDALARADEPYYYSLESAILLHRLRAPGVAAVLRQVGLRVPATYDLRDQVFLMLGIALFEIRDDSYLDLVKTALRSENLFARTEAFRFAAKSGDLKLVPPLLDLLDDNTETGYETVETVKGRDVSTRETIAGVAAASLRRLTLQSIGRDAARWRTWWKRHQRSGHRQLVSEFLARHACRIRSVPIWEANRWIEQLGTTTDPLILPMLRAYIDRPDLNPSATGPHSFRGSGSSGIPMSLVPPQVVTSLLRLAKLAHQEARSLLEHATQAAHHEVRLCAALAIGTYDRRAALHYLSSELARPEQWIRDKAAEFLLLLDDARGIPILIDRLERDHEAARYLACRDLRLYTQQPLPCDSTLPPTERAANVERWRSWWSTVTNFQPKRHQAALDLLAIPEVLPVSFKPSLRVAQANVIR